MARKLSEILKDRTIFSAEQEKRILENAKKEAEMMLKRKNESVSIPALLEKLDEALSENN